MEWFVIITVAVLVLVGGCIVAILWWRLVTPVAPYRDELEKAKARSAKPKDDNVEIIRGFDPDKK